MLVRLRDWIKILMRLSETVITERFAIQESAFLSLSDVNF